MIERFNFFDIYGYLIPGVFWLALMWLPFGLRSGFPSWSTAQITVVGLVGGYILGHLLYAMARLIFPGRIKDKQGCVRVLSSLLLDDDNQVLSPPVKAKLAEELKRRFGIEVSDRAHHGDVFFLCRTALAQAKVGSYAEQYQGLNSLTRGLATACIFAVALYSGLVIQACFLSSAAARGQGCFVGAAIALALAPLIVIVFLDGVSKRLVPKMHLPLFRDVLSMAEAIAFAIALFAIGIYAGYIYPLSTSQVYLLALIGAILLVGCRRFAIAAKAFNDSLAQAVYRDFVVLTTAPRSEPDRSGD
jgi:hypothetical protein